MDGVWSGWVRLELAGTGLSAISVAPNREGYPTVLGIGTDGTPLAFSVGDDNPHPVPLGGPELVKARPSRSPRSPPAPTNWTCCRRSVSTRTATSGAPATSAEPTLSDRSGRLAG